MDLSADLRDYFEEIALMSPVNNGCGYSFLRHIFVLLDL